MSLVDLGLHEGEQAPERGIGIGWEHDGVVVARMTVEREADVIAIRALEVEETQRRRGFGRALVDALADVATDASALTVEAPQEAAAFFARCGFVADSGRLVRALAPRPAPREAVNAITLVDLERAVRTSWSRETAEAPELWSEDNPAIEHCGVTALIVRELLGGEILVAGVVRDGRRVCRHAWNRLPSGVAIDLTREQFRDGETFEQPVVGEPLVVERHPERYELFARRVREALVRKAPG